MNKLIKQIIELRDTTPCKENLKRCGCEEFDDILDQLIDLEERLQRCNSPHYFSDGETIDYISIQLDKILDVDVYDDKFDKEIQEIKRIENE